MRAAPAIQVLLRQFGVWQAAVVAVLLVGQASLLVWLVGREVQDSLHQLATLAGAAALLPLAWSLARTRAVHLTWDGQGWTVQAAPLLPGVTPTPGDITVAVDLGLWMLLRFQPQAVSRWLSLRYLPQYLPVQRRSMEAQWHGLRCAVYSSRPRSAHDQVAKP